VRFLPLTQVAGADADALRAALSRHAVRVFRPVAWAAMNDGVIVAGAWVSAPCGFTVLPRCVA
jgi:hypothetical protein